jgi:2-polyprenyl-6-methoxyphenol hydroxylase-like FAD-dependent oxidoreductase
MSTNVEAVVDAAAVDVDVDVAIVGFGPVGQTLAALLGRKGHRVAAVERYRDIYPLPRAVRIDGEVLRAMQNIGVLADIQHELLPVENYTWFGADGDPILEIRIPPHPSGHHDHLFHQPTLERALWNRVEQEPSVQRFMGWTGSTLAVSDHDVTLGITSEVGEVKTIRAKYVVGADGANSFVRVSSGIGVTDLGFSEFWLVVDIRPHNMADFDLLPVAAQLCDPKRPATIVGNGTHHRRWEFMLLPGETPADFADPARVWELLAPFAKPDQAELVRHAVYNFRSIIANEIHTGRVFLAGDAAHTMPPFMGEGMCTGIRDVINLSWKLDLVLKGLVSEAILDTYTTERLPFVHTSVHTSIGMGQVSCELNPEAAAGRDAAMRSGAMPPPPAPPIMVSSLITADDALGGTLSVQGLLQIGEVRGRADELLGDGFTLITRTGDPAATIETSLQTWFASIGGRVVTLDPTANQHAVDIDGRLTDWLDGAGVDTVLYRPDQFVFGSAAGTGPKSKATIELLSALRASLPTPAIVLDTPLQFTT